MKRLLVLVGSTAGGSVGWWAGAFIGPMTAFFVAVFGFALGTWFGARLANRWM